MEYLVVGLLFLVFATGYIITVDKANNHGNNNGNKK